MRKYAYAALIGVGFGLSAAEVRAQDAGIRSEYHQTWNPDSRPEFITVTRSTITSSSRAGADIDATADLTIDSSYIQGSTAVHLAGSTRTVISGSTLAATVSVSNVLLSTRMCSDLSLTSSTLIGGAQGGGVWLHEGNRGLFLIATNTIQGVRYGIHASSQQAETKVYITSNTILGTLSTANDTYGIHINGLTTGATIQQNNIYFRTSGSANGRTAYGLYANTANGLVIAHNRVNMPDMINASGGSFEAASFYDVDGSSFIYNDIHAVTSRADLVNLYGLRLEAGSQYNTIKNNVFLASFTVTGASATVKVSADSQTGFYSDYNDFFSSGTTSGQGVKNSAVWGTAACGLPEWTNCGNGQDAHSIAEHPYWAGTAAGSEDFHPRTEYLNGRFNPATGSFDQTDTVMSLTIDAADPDDPYAAELSPNGLRANQGSYGNTWQASLSFVIPDVPITTTSYVNDDASAAQLAMRMGYNVTVDRPWYSAVYTHRGGQAGTAYQILVYEDDSLTDLLWDSGEQAASVASGARLPSAQESAANLLSKNKCYWWQIRFKAGANAWGNYTTGMLFGYGPTPLRRLRGGSWFCDQGVYMPKTASGPPN